MWATPLLSLFLALSLLLVVAGDVETNPGPISGKRLSFIVMIMIDQAVTSFPSDELLAQVDDSMLSKFICDIFLQTPSEVTC